MANSIALASKFLTALDEVYKVSAKTSILDAPAGFTQEAMNANEIRIPKVALQGLGDYNKATGYVQGDVTFAYETHTFTQDRGRTFNVDKMDDMETVETAFAAVTSQFVRTKVAPELDAYRISKMAGLAGNTATPATLTKSTALQAIDDGIQAMEDAEVGTETVVAFVTPEVKKFIKQSDLISREFMTNVGTRVINRDVDTLDGMLLITTPQSRMYTAITLYDGTTGGQEAGGYIKEVATGKDVNFMLVDTNAILGVTKTAMPRIFDPETNQEANAWKFDYRLYHDLFVPDNKVNGIYLHNKA